MPAILLLSRFIKATMRRYYWPANFEACIIDAGDAGMIRRYAYLMPISPCRFTMPLIFSPLPLMPRYYFDVRCC